MTVFDSVSPEAYPAEDIVDVSNGIPNAPLGWIGLRPMEYAPFCIANAYLADFEVIVRSAASGEVRYRVYLPLGQMKKRIGVRAVSGNGLSALPGDRLGTRLLMGPRCEFRVPSAGCDVRLLAQSACEAQDGD